MLSDFEFTPIEGKLIIKFCKIFSLLKVKKIIMIKLTKGDSVA